MKRSFQVDSPTSTTLWRISSGFGGVLACFSALAGPEGMAVVTGTANATRTGPDLKVNVASDRAILQWASFNVAHGESVTFNQPSPASIVWNQVLDVHPSTVFGSIHANGIVVMANQAGFWFGPDSVVKAASFVATTAGGPPADFMAGGQWSLNIAPPLASIINYGHLEAARGGSVFLVAEKIENHGILSAPDGTLGLYAGKEVLVSERPDGRGLSAKISLPEGSISNDGQLIADAGTIALHARVVNQDGLLQANTIQEKDGVVELIATESVQLGAHSTISASNQSSTSRGNAGTIRIKSGDAYTDTPTSKISADGGMNGGDGGFIEVSAENLSAIQSKITANAASGSHKGQLYIDPTDIVIAQGGTSPTTGSVDVNVPGTRLTFDPSAFEGFSAITLQARNNITINTAWTLQDTEAPDAKLRLEAGKDISFAQNAGLFAGKGWSVSLSAGTRFTAEGGNLSGTGSILLNGGAFIIVADKSAELIAGKDITVGRGAIRSTAKGSITATAIAGNINTGTSTEGYRFNNQGIGYFVSDNLGGISTAAGGNVTLTAGKDVVSLLPTLTGNHTDAGTGAFGEQGGDVTITAGGNVYGHFVLANGTGKITAGNFAGETTRQFALSLIKGSWEVNAKSIALQEVRNPNGIFNRNGNQNTPTFHKFDYDPSASLTLKASDSVSLQGASLPRNSSEAGIPVILPPSLTIEAGAGGVVLGNNVYLFPSAKGQLDISTKDGGDLRSKDGNRTFELVLSDSAATQYKFVSGQFGLNDHASEPRHVGDLLPTHIDVSGSIQNLIISSPKAAEVSVGKDVLNTSLLVQNLTPDSVSKLAVAGNILNRNDYTFVTLSTDDDLPDFQLLDIAEPSAGVGGFTYDAVSRTLGFRGRMTENTRSVLSDLHIRTFENGTPGIVGSGTPILDTNGEPVTTPVKFLSTSIIDQLYAGSQDVPARAPLGYQVSGPGLLEVSANKIDLGVTAGIVSTGAADNSALAKLSPFGADLKITTANDLVLFSSAIVSKAGGKIEIDSKGKVQVGSNLVLPTSDQARGIYTTSGSDVSVKAVGDILVNGSRIAAYDGGNVTVRSSNGNIDAGTGGLSLQNVEQVKVDPITHAVTTLTDYIPGSGILATTFSTTPTLVGNVLVETPRGNILARSGGVIQASFNKTPVTGAEVRLTAGTKPTEGVPGSGFVGSIDASRSGVIGGNVKIEATGPIVGVVFASGNINLTTPQSVTVTALAQGSANISAGGTVSGTVVGIGSANVSGGNISASVLSQNATTSGASSGAVGFAAANVAAATTQAASAEAPAKKAAAPTPAAEDDDKSKLNKKPQLVRTVGRVTVILPTQRQ